MPINDQNPGGAAALNAPFATALAVTPSDSTTFDNIPRGLYIGGAGNVAVRMDDNGATLTFIGVPVGAILPLRVDRVMATNTTATNIIALY